MNKEQIIEAMNHIDPVLIEAADRSAFAAKRSRRGWSRPAVIAACLCLVLAGTALAAELSGVRVVDFFHHELRSINPGEEPESYSGFTVAGDVRYFPLSELSPEIAGMNQTDTWAAGKSFPSWADMEAFIGVPAMENLALADASAGESIYDAGVPGARGNYVAWFCASENGVACAHMRGSFALHGKRTYQRWIGAVQVNIAADLVTEYGKDWEQEYGLDMNKNSIYYSDDVELSRQEYVTPSGLPVQIFQADYPEQETIQTDLETGETSPYLWPAHTRYDARFVLNGMMFSVSVTDNSNFGGEEADSELVWSTLLEVLDGFVCGPVDVD